MSPAAKSRAAARKPVDRPAVRVGIGGWTFAPWRGLFYPPELAQRCELEFASRAVTAIEVNGTFYRAQSPATYAKWRRETPDGFVFSLKAPRYATARKHLAEAGESVDRFVRGGITELGDRLGPLLWQLPPGKRFEPDELAAFLQLLPAQVDGVALRHALEVRDPSFACSQYLQLARRHGCASVFTDSADYPSFADLTGDFVYARLMRSQAQLASGYAAAALARWAARARLWAAGGEPDDLPRVAPTVARKAVPREVFVYFIGAAKQRNPAAALALLRQLS